MNNDNGILGIKPIRKVGTFAFAFYDIRAALMQFLMFFLTFFTLMTPRDVLGFKKLFLGLALIVGFPVYSKEIKKYRVLYFFSAMLPALLYVLSTMMTFSPLLAINYLYPFTYLLLVLPIIKWNINIEQITLFVGNLMAGLIILSVGLDIMRIWSVYTNPVLNWLNENGEAQISHSPYAMFVYVIFLKSSPILLYNLMYYIRENEKIYTSLIFIAILFTGTRANIFLGTLFLVFAVLIYSKNKAVKVLFTLIVLLICYFGGNILWNSVNTINWAKASGDQTRIGTVESILNVLNGNKLYWFTGMGFGSEYFNLGRMSMTETSELSYFEFLREVGIPFFIMTMFYICYPLRSLYKKDKFIFCFYIAYLIAGVVEPFIFTSTGFFVIMLMYTQILRHR